MTSFDQSLAGPLQHDCNSLAADRHRSDPSKAPRKSASRATGVFAQGMEDERSLPGSLRRRQYGALPYRFAPNGDLQILLITSRGTGRWVIPKGWPMQWHSAAETAAQEALEEAGIEGDVGSAPIGSFEYLKHLAGGRGVVCQVKVFALHVRKELEEWPEKSQRMRYWMTPQNAAGCVEESGLADLIGSVARRLDWDDDDELASSMSPKTQQTGLGLASLRAASAGRPRST